LLLNAWSGTATIKELKEHLHAKLTSHNGGNTLRKVTGKIRLEFAECCKGQEKIILGNQIAEDQIRKDMMIQIWNQNHLQTTLAQLDSTVLKLYVLLVVWL